MTVPGTGNGRFRRTIDYRVDHARVYDLPDALPPIIISGFGRKSIELAAKVGDGYCTTAPDPESVQMFRSAGGGEKVVQGGLKVCWGQDEREAFKTVHRLWANQGLSGELAQVLPTPEHFEQASELVTEEMVAESTPCGPDVTHRQHLGEASIEPAWLLRAWRPITRVPAQIVIVCMEAFSQLARPSARRGEFRAVPFKAGVTDRDAGRKAGRRDRSACRCSGGECARGQCAYGALRGLSATAVIDLALVLAVLGLIGSLVFARRWRRRFGVRWAMSSPPCCWSWPSPSSWWRSLE